MNNHNDFFNDLIPSVEKLSINAKNSKIFISGATGFLGKWLLHTILQANEEFSANVKVFCLSRKPELFLRDHPEFVQNNIRFLTGDIRSFDLPKESFDYVIHAATSSTGQIQNNDLHSTIVEGTERVLKLNARKIIYVSSGGVYGKQSGSNFSEDLKPNPQNVYGKAKLIAEEICLDANMQSVIIRPFSFLGPFLPLDAHYAAGNFINDVLHKREIIINSDGSALRSYMYPTDLCEWLFQALFQGKNGDIFNIGSDKPVSVLQLAQRINQYMNREPSDIVVKEKTSNNALAYVPDITKIKNSLGVNIKILLDEAIQKTIKFYKYQCE